MIWNNGMYLWHNQQYLYASLNTYHSIYNGSTGNINTLTPSFGFPNVTFAIYYIACKVNTTSPNYYMSIYFTSARGYMLLSGRDNNWLHASLMYYSGSYFNMRSNDDAGIYWNAFPNLNNLQTYSYYTGFDTPYTVTINGFYIT